MHATRDVARSWEQGQFPRIPAGPPGWPGVSGACRLAPGMVDLRDDLQMRAQWIMSPRDDAAWLILPALVGYLFIYLNGLGVSSLTLWWFWNVSVNGPHFFATISRTYLDPEEWRQRKALLIGSLGFLLLGPAVIALCLALESRGPFLAFWLFQAVWAYYHVMRQHFGFMALYQKRNGEAVGRDNAADFWIFNLLMLAPAVMWLAQYTELRAALGWPAGLSGSERQLQTVLGLVILAAVVALLAKEILGYRRTGRVNGPKLLLLAAYVPLHMVLLLHPTVAPRADLLLVNAVITFPHSVQYLAFVWFYNRNRYGRSADAGAFGIAGTLNRNLGAWLGCAVLFGLVLYYVEWYFEARRVPFALGYFRGAQTPIGLGFELSQLFAVTWLGIVFNHQYLDQKIWHIRSDTRLNRDLRLTGGPLVPEPTPT